MVKSAFRGSDDAVTFPFNIPENAFAAVALRQIEPVLLQVGRPSLAAKVLQELRNGPAILTVSGQTWSLYSRCPFLHKVTGPCTCAGG